MATDLYTVLPGLEVTQDEILQAELAAQKILEAKYPDLDLRQGTGLRDLVIRPSATLLALVNKAVVFYFAQNTLPGVTDSTPTDIVDKILSNWFVERIAGNKSVISARLYFAKQKNVAVSSEIFFSTDNTKKFYPITTYSFSPANMTYDSFSSEYYVDVELAADKEGADYDLTSGSLLYFSNFDPYFLRGEINYLKSMSSVTETNTTFISRAKTAVSTRNLINIPSVDAKLKADFNYVTAITTVGAGDPDMYRDQVTVMAPPSNNPVLIHIGGKTDIYSRVPLEKQILQYPTDATGKAYINGPYLEISRSTITGGTENDTVAVYRTVSVTSIAFSGTTATVSAAAHGFNVGDSIIIAGATPTVYNGTFVVATAATNSFTYVLPSVPASTPTGTMVAQILTPYATSYPSQIVLNAALSRSGTTVTITSNNHGVIPGRYVKITGCTQANFNGWFKATAVTQNTITVTNPDITLPTNATGTPLLTITAPMQDTGLSANQQIVVDFGGANANKTVSFNTYGFKGLTSLQSYLNLGDNKVLAGDFLARGYNIYLISMNIVGYNGPPPSSAQCTTVANTYLESLDPGSPFIMADLIAALNASGVTTIQTPIATTYRYFHRDNIPYVSGTITDYLDPNDSTAIFMLESLTTTNGYI